LAALAATLASATACGGQGAPPPDPAPPVTLDSDFVDKTAPPEPGPETRSNEACELPLPTEQADADPDGRGRFLTLPTYDGSNQPTHINVQFDQNGRFGHRYWMTMTPYPFGDATKENPSILVSEDGLDWSEPEGIANPVSGVPDDVDRKGHYSDGYLLPRPDGFELWFRYNPARADGSKPDNSTNIVYRMTSSDGIKWSRKEAVFDGGDPSYMSPSLLIEGSRYRLWYSNYGGQLVHTESADLESWTAPQAVRVELSDGYVPWHQEMVRTDLGYEALLLGYLPSQGDGDSPPFALFYARSDDGLDFGEASLIEPTKVDPRLDGYHFYKSSLVKACGSYQLYLSVVAPDRAYKAFYRQLPVEDLPSLFA
jgi:hypothetical protein